MILSAEISEPEPNTSIGNHVSWLTAQREGQSSRRVSRRRSTSPHKKRRVNKVHPYSPLSKNLRSKIATDYNILPASALRADTTQSSCITQQPSSTEPWCPHVSKHANGLRELDSPSRTELTTPDTPEYFSNTAGSTTPEACIENMHPGDRQTDEHTAQNATINHGPYLADPPAHLADSIPHAQQTPNNADNVTSNVLYKPNELEYHLDLQQPTAKEGAEWFGSLDKTLKASQASTTFNAVEPTAGHDDFTNKQVLNKTTAPVYTHGIVMRSQAGMIT